MVKIKYEKPVLISLSGKDSAHGACKPGSGEIAGNCRDGPAANDICKVGSSAIGGQSCRDGGLNLTRCVLGPSAAISKCKAGSGV